MHLLRAYQQVSALLDRIDFPALQPGFHRFRFALYDSAHACVDGVLLPRDERFRGNTAIDDAGTPLAIWNLAGEDGDTTALASGMVHEMFHCFQHERGETRYPDDLSLLAYPDDPAHFARKHHENRLLADAFAHQDTDALRRFCAVRRARLAQYPQAVRQECLAETIEGTAEFVGLKALKTLAPTQYERTVAAYLCKLREDLPLLFDVRRGAYYTSALLCLTLDALHLSMRNDFGPQTLYEQNALSGAPDGACPDFPGLPLAYAAWVERKRSAIDACVQAAAFTPCPARVVGYDPMNMQRAGNLLLCMHFVAVRDAVSTRTLPGPVVLRLAEGSDRETEGYYLPASNFP